MWILLFINPMNIEMCILTMNYQVTHCNFLHFGLSGLSCLGSIGFAFLYVFEKDEGVRKK